MSTLISDPFWSENLSILYSPDRLSEIVPKSSMSTAERLNAMVRFAAYAGLALDIWYSNHLFLITPVIALIVTKLMYDTNKTKFVKESDDLTENFRANQTEINPRGMIDGKECVMPSENNPFMNVSLGDYVSDPDRPPACSADDPIIKSKIDDNFGTNIFRDTTDVYGTMMNSRQFYTMPNTTIPDDQDAFKDFLYGDMKNPGCKQGDLNRCIDHDLRQDRKPPQLDTRNMKYTY